jgi:hypothetical protein
MDDPDAHNDNYFFRSTMVISYLMMILSMLQMDLLLLNILSCTMLNMPSSIIWIMITYKNSFAGDLFRFSRRLWLLQLSMLVKIYVIHFAITTNLAFLLLGYNAFQLILILQILLLVTAQLVLNYVLER